MPNFQPLVLFSSLLIFLSLPNLNRAAIHIVIGTCHASGYLTHKSSFSITQNYADCCQEGQLYPRYRCSPPVTNTTDVIMDIGGSPCSGILNRKGGKKRGGKERTQVHSLAPQMYTEIISVNRLGCSGVSGGV